MSQGMNEALHQLNMVSSQILQNCPLQDFLVGESAWYSALADLVVPEVGHTYTLLACKLASRCSHRTAWNNVLEAVIMHKSGMTVLAGAELVSQGRQMSKQAVMAIISLMQTMPGRVCKAHA